MLWTCVVETCSRDRITAHAHRKKQGTHVSGTCGSDLSSHLNCHFQTHATWVLRDIFIRDMSHKVEAVGIYTTCCSNKNLQRCLVPLCARLCNRYVLGPVTDNNKNASGSEETLGQRNSWNCNQTRMLISYFKDNPILWDRRLKDKETKLKPKRLWLTCCTLWEGCRATKNWKRN